MDCSNIIIERNRIAVGDIYPDHEIVLSDDETNAVSAIHHCLEENGVDFSAVSIERAKEYLKLVAYRYFAFCRLKLSGRVKYIELSISSKDAKRFIADPRFADLVIGKQRFSRVPISAPTDIEKYLDVVVLAYTWATNTAAQYDPQE